MGLVMSSALEQTHGAELQLTGSPVSLFGLPYTQPIPCLCSWGSAQPGTESGLPYRELPALMSNHRCCYPLLRTHPV